MDATAVSLSEAGAFECAFEPRNCSHLAIFTDAYQRTNRTKGTKILRCFPHCCPRHVERSYCGGPLYLQVDLTPSALHAPLESPELVVFAHFHPRDTNGLALGQSVARDIFRRDQQTDINTSGEWIGARLIASADQTTWLYEVNPSGRWYYQWESGATKVQRATEHVFQVYVLLLDRPHSMETESLCRVVATTSSPSFKMISFRRASTETKSLATAPPLPVRASSVSSSSSSSSKSPHQPTPRAETTGDAHTPHRSRESDDSTFSFDTELASSFHSLHYQPFLRESSSSASSPSHTRVLPVPTSPTLSLLPPERILAISHNAGALLDLLQRLPSSALGHVLPEIRLRVLQHSSSDEEASTLVQLFTSAEPQHHSPSVIAVVLRLALWFLFDGTVAQNTSAALYRASAGLLDKTALYTSYYTWLEALDRSVNQQLAASHPNMTLAALARALRREPVNNSFCRGLESFVAQAREVFLAGQSLTRPQRGLDRPPASSSAVLQWICGVWLVDVPSVSWRVVNAAAAPVASPSAFVMLWAWRQLLTMRFALETETGDSQSLVLTATALRSSSSSVGHMTCGSRLVVDDRPRWLRVYPTGESTSSVWLGAQRLCHYVASHRPETDELLVNVYSWPSADAPVEQRSVFCVRWCLSIRADARLDVRVAVECGRLRADADVAALDERPLTHRLRVVEGWATAFGVQYECRRIGN